MSAARRQPGTAAALLLAGLIAGSPVARAETTPAAATDPALAPVEPAQAALARSRAALLTLRSNPALAAQVPDEIVAVDALLREADANQHDAFNGPHRIYIAERKVAWLQALAEVRVLEAQYEALRRQRDGLSGNQAR